MKKSKNPGIFIRGLRQDLQRSQLKDSLTRLLLELNINVSKSSIDIVFRKNYALGFVHLESVKTTNYALFHLSHHSRRQKINFNFNEISHLGKDLYIAGIKMDEDGSNGRNRSNNGVQEVKGQTVEAGTSVSGLASSSRSKGLDTATSVSGLTPKGNIHYFHFLENLGNETRNVEFKEGGGNYRQNVLKEHVGKYVCAFLNSNEGGCLLVGVNDKGCVKGIPCNHSEEDSIRLRIDEAIKQISPSAFPSVYSVTFIPVLKNGSFSDNLKVLEVKVNPSDNDSFEELYSFQDKFYIRRDGSVQCLKSTEIKDWAQKQARRHNPRGITHQSQIDGITAKLQDIENQLNKKKKKKHKSNVCVLL